MAGNLQVDRAAPRMINLAAPDQPEPATSRWQWPEHSPVPPHVRRQIEAAHFAPQQRQQDDVAELRATIEQQAEQNGALARRVAALEAAMRKRAPTKVLIDGICDGLAQTLKAERKDTTARFHAQDKRLDAVEARPVYRFVGTFTEGSEYEPGQIAVRSGGSWICIARTRGTPGKCEDWAQLSRPGRDGRDARDLRQTKGQST
jgi:hypothetical protein